MARERRDDWMAHLLHGVGVFSTLLIIALLMATIALQVSYLANDTISPIDASNPDSARMILERAEDAVGAVGLVLSFLEGASVIIGLGFGAVTLYGLRNTQETREELRAEVDKVEDIRRQLEKQLAELERYRPDLAHLRTLRSDLVQSQTSLEQTIDNVARVLQANQEFTLRNHDTAYMFSEQVLAQDPDNWLALYIAGWLEVHERDQLEHGINHLHRAVELERNWPAALAAYGVAVRRKARHTEDPAEKERLFMEAERALLSALAQSPRLMDFNSESFWGAVGGIRLETKRYDSAMEAYENALRITPNSSYPAGNAAALRLRHAKISGDPADMEKALDAFEMTDSAARREQLLNPNDYYLWMDLAQANAVLGQRDSTRFDQAQDMLDKALLVYPSVNVLLTSRRGWQTMLDNCPDSWGAVRDAIKAALDRLDTVIADAA